MNDWTQARSGASHAMVQGGGWSCRSENRSKGGREGAEGRSSTCLLPVFRRLELERVCGLGQGLDWRRKSLFASPNPGRDSHGWDVLVLILISSVFEPGELASQDPRIRYLRKSFSH